MKVYARPAGASTDDGRTPTRMQVLFCTNCSDCFSNPKKHSQRTADQRQDTSSLKLLCTCCANAKQKLLLVLELELLLAPELKSELD